MISTRVAQAAVVLLLALQQAQALSLKLHKHRKAAAKKPSPRRHLETRAAPDPLDLDNLYDLYYSTDLTVGGQDVSLQLDTGSSEMWVRPPKAFTASTATTSTTSLGIRYGIGSFNGTITTADVEMGDITISKQAFLTYTTGSIDNVFQAGLDGMLGLGFDDGSHVLSSLRRQTNDDSGRTLLTNFYLNNPDQPHTMSFFMSRNNDPTNDDDGLFMIGEPEPEYAAVTQAKPLPVHVNTAANDFQRWSSYLDGIEVNGEMITGLKSVVPGVPTGKLVANLDTGTSLGWIPAAAVDAIYKNIPGAQYFADTDQYTVPCMSAPRLAFWFGGVRFPIHPLDVTRSQSQLDANGNRTYFCTNAFIHTAALSSQSSTLDMQLGDSFLRNVIAQYDFGDFADHSTANVRMVSTTTDELKALNDFNAVRSKLLGIATPPVVTELPGGPQAPGESTTTTGPTVTVPPPDAPHPTPPPGTEDNTGSGIDETNPPSDGNQPDNGSGRVGVSVAALLLPSLLLFAL